MLVKANLPCCQHCGSTNMELPVRFEAHTGLMKAADDGYAHCLDCDDNEGGEMTDIETADMKVVKLHIAPIENPVAHFYRMPQG